MLDHLSAIARIEDGATPPRTLFGALPTGLGSAVLHGMRGDRPNARKEGANLVVVAPVATPGAGHVAWIFDVVPPVTDLPDLITRVTALSQIMGGAPPVPTDDAPAPFDTIATCLGRFAAAGRLRRRGVLQTMVDAIVETGAAAGAVAFPLTARRVGRLTVSNRGFLPHADEIRALARRARADGQLRFEASVTALEEDALESGLVLDAVGHASFVGDVPETGEAGVGLVLFDPSPEGTAQIAALRDLAMLSTRHRKRRTAPGAVQARRLAAVAIGLGLVVYLALPAPLVISATGLSRPAEAISASLHFDAFLAEMVVAVGDRVQEGDLLARFSAPDLEERRSEAALQITIEEVTAQAALAQNDYGAYVLAEQRIAAQQRRLENLQERLNRLELRAPIDGNVVAAIGRGLIGTFVPTGQEVALIQQDQRFALTLNFLRVDAPLIEAGQTGNVYFRGISGESFGFLVTTPVLVERNGETGEERLTARARVVDEDQSRLLAGLSGYARIEAGEAPRVLSFGRYAIEYIKVKAWTYLGLRL